jgi:hypothetical protein
MRAEDFRRIALNLPGAVEGQHNGHADFRVAGRIFATLGYPDAKWAMVKLRSEQQDMLTSAKPAIFTPATGAWGKRGSTLLLLELVDESSARSAVEMAWSNIHV